MTSPFSGGDIGIYDGVTLDTNVNSLVWRGFKWGQDGTGTQATVTFSFPSAGASWINDYFDQEPFDTFQPFTLAQQAAARNALALWSDVANITFVEVPDTSSDVGDIRFGNSGKVTNSPYFAWAYFPIEDDGSAFPESGDVWVDKKAPPNLQLKPGQPGLEILLHEIGHALGLDHPFDDGNPGEPVIDPAFYSDKYTVMVDPDGFYPGTLAYASTPQMLDILAIQHIYGANMTTRTGDDTYKFSTSEVFKTIWDAGGNDTLDFSNQGGAAVQGVLQEGTFFTFGGHPSFGTTSIVGIAFGVTIENVIAGRSGSSITGNDLANSMIGGNGTDQFDGSGGNDHLEGRGGGDSLQGGIGDNWIDGGTGQDLLWGSFGKDTLLGGSGNDQLTAELGDDWLDGGLGNDTMTGSQGNDTYVINTAGDIIDEGGWLDSNDVVRSSIAVNLTTLAGGRIEHTVLLGTGALSAIGNDADNELTGNNGANILDGGTGADNLTGGKGGDTYFVDNVGDVITEDIAGTAGGTDTVKSWIDFSLASLVNIEKLTLLGFADLDATGNALKNTLTGNSGANVLDGGLDKDTMAGGAGDDYYIVDNIGDLVKETITNGKGGGIDTVDSSAVSYRLSSNVDHLILHEGSFALNGTGNALNNSITGNSNANKLDGGGANDLLIGNDGNDTLLGGAGNDTITGGVGLDKLTGGTGRDTFDYDLLSEAGDTMTDFKLGLTGDVLNLADLLNSFGDPLDAFGGGYLAFTHSGTSTLVQVDADGGSDGFSTFATLLHVHLTSADTNNFLV